MRKQILFALALVLGLSTAALAQVTNSGTITTTGAATCVTANSCVRLPATGSLPANSGAVSIQLGVTAWTGTVTIETTTDGTNYVTAQNCSSANATVTTMTANGQVQCNVGAISKIQVRGTSSITGTLTVTMTSSVAAAKGAPGATGSVTSIAATTPITVSPNPITTTGTIACATCVTSAAAVPSTLVPFGQGTQVLATNANFSYVTGTNVLQNGQADAQGFTGQGQNVFTSIGDTAGKYGLVAISEKSGASTTNPPAALVAAYNDVTNSVIGTARKNLYVTSQVDHANALGAMTGIYVEQVFGNTNALSYARGLDVTTPILTGTTVVTEETGINIGQVGQLAATGNAFALNIDSTLAAGDFAIRTGANGLVRFGSLSSAATKCVHADLDGTLGIAAADCGGSAPALMEFQIGFGNSSDECCDGNAGFTFNPAPVSSTAFSVNALPPTGAMNSPTGMLIGLSVPSMGTLGDIFGASITNSSAGGTTVASSSVLYLYDNVDVVTGDATVLTVESNTTSAANAYGLKILDITAGTVADFAISTGAGDIVFGTLAATGAATGKTIVCADTNGKLYRSSSAVTCAN